MSVKSYPSDRFGSTLDFCPLSSALDCFIVRWFVWPGGCVCSIKGFESNCHTAVKITKQCLFCVGVHVGKMDKGNCPTIAFDFHNCTAGIVCAVFCLENIDFALYVLRNRLNWFACVSALLLDKRPFNVFITFFFFFFSCKNLSWAAPSWTFSYHNSGNLFCKVFQRKAIC